eukprot:scaffold134778_cov39-Prasinocladus_malaysianus.AAC.1
MQKSSTGCGTLEAAGRGGGVCNISWGSDADSSPPCSVSWPQTAAGLTANSSHKNPSPNSA